MQSEGSVQSATYRKRPALMQATAAVVTLAAVTVPAPLPLRIEQFCTGLLGWVVIVTLLSVPIGQRFYENKATVEKHFAVSPAVIAEA